LIENQTNGITLAGCISLLVVVVLQHSGQRPVVVVLLQAAYLSLSTPTVVDPSLVELLHAAPGK